MIIEYFTRRTNNKLEAKNIVSFEIALNAKAEFPSSIFKLSNN